MRATNAPSSPQIRLHPDAIAVEVQALYRGVVIGSRCLVGDEADAFLIGCAKGVDAPAAAGLLPGDSHRLVSRDGGGFAIELTEQMTGTVIFEDRTAPLEELLRAHGPHFTAPPAARLQIACGEVAFLVSSTAAPPLIPRPAWVRLKDHWAALVAVAGALLTLMIVSFLPPDMRAITGDTMDEYRRVKPFIDIPPAPPPAKGAGPAMAGGSPKPTGGGGAAGPARRPPKRAIARPRTAATAADYTRRGALGVLLAYNGESLAAVLSGDNALVAQNFEGLDNSVGPGDGPGFGPGHDGINTGPGDDGQLVGSGHLRGIGICDADCQKRGLLALGPGGPGGLRRHDPIAPPHVITGAPKVQGTLDKDIVRRIIRRHLNEVKFCYEQQLPRHPDLAGRVTVQFTIAPEGHVAASLLQLSSLNNLSVESCIVQAVRRWEFPKRESGAAIVSYPFVLVPAGAP